MINPKSLIGCVLLFLVVGCTSPQEDLVQVTLTGKTMGTTYSIKYITINDPDAHKALQTKIDTKLESINELMSTYRPHSELSRFNQSPKTGWVEVSSDTAQVVAKAIEISEQTHGSFDATVAPLVNLWNFGPDINPHQMPTDIEILGALGNIGWSEIHVRHEPPAIKKDRAELTLDLSAIAKGFAVDEVAALLKAKGLENFFVEIGGEVRTSGSKTKDEPWRVGIEKPEALRGNIQKAMPLRNLAMATSGDYRNFREFEGKKLSHMIDPKTGRPVEHDLASVTVITDNCMEADAYATAVMVMGPQAGFAFATEQRLAVLMLIRDGDGFIEKTTSEFDQLQKTETKKSNVLQMFLISLVVFGIAVAGMAVGVIFSNRRIKGSCGGLNNFKDDQGNSICEACTNPAPTCTGENARQSETVEQTE